MTLDDLITWHQDNALQTRNGAEYCRFHTEAAALLSGMAKKRDKFDPMTLVDEESGRFRAAWAEWIEYRKERKASRAESCMRKQYHALKEWQLKGHDPVLIMQTSITNGWMGLFEPKNAIRQQVRDVQAVSLFGGDTNYLEGQALPHDFPQAVYRIGRS